MQHFGFRLKRPEDIDAAVAALREAGASIDSIGEFVPGEPYVFARDPDGYALEVWFEPLRTGLATASGTALPPPV